MPRQLVIAIAAVVTGWIPVGPLAGADTSSPLLGVHEFMLAPRNGVPDRVPLLLAVGAQVVRLPVTWHLMEGSRKGRTPTWFWQQLDADVAAAERAQAKLIITFGQTPCWASSDPAKDCLNGTDFVYLHYRPMDANDYADALARLLQRYGSRVFAWELWNEPNLVGNFRWPECGGTGDNRGMCLREAAANDDYGDYVDLDGARQYVALVKAAYARMKSLDPNVIVLAGSLGGSDVDYLKQMYDDGVKGSFSALSMHPYTATYPVSRSDPRYGRSYGPDECFAGTTDSRFWCFKQGVENVRQTMLARQDSSPIWFTEFGFSSTTVWNGSGLDGQAAQLRSAVSIIRNWDFVPVACWYQLLDRTGADGRETRFGLFDTALALKPAGAAYKEVAGPGKPLLVAPAGSVPTGTPTFVWRAVAGAVGYKLYVNQYSTPNVPGKINLEVTPEQASCATGVTCQYNPGIALARAGAEWWVTANLAGGVSLLSDSMLFRVDAVVPAMNGP
jgi:hypothetical protein